MKTNLKIVQASSRKSPYDERATLATIPFEFRKYPKMVEKILNTARSNAERNE
jgi:hypothetical protein